MTTLLNKISSVNEAMRALLPEAGFAIANTKIPLDERWEIFKALPSWCKEHNDYITDFPKTAALLEQEDLFYYDCPPFYPERHQTFGMVEAVERLEDHLMDDDTPEDEKQKIVDTFKAEILSMNLGSMTYDW